MSHARAALALAAGFCIPPAAQAYRPFNSTDAAVADRTERFGADIAKVLKENPKEAIYQKVPWYTAVVQDGWKYVRYLQPGVPDELYDLTTDPEELKNLAADAKHADRFKSLRAALAAELNRTNAPEVLMPPKP